VAPIAGRAMMNRGAKQPLLVIVDAANQPLGVLLAGELQPGTRGYGAGYLSADVGSVAREIIGRLRAGTSPVVVQEMATRQPIGNAVLDALLP
jgi:hypothetical protein